MCVRACTLCVLCLCGCFGSGSYCPLYTDLKALKVGLCECESVYINEIVCVCEMLKFKILVERTDLKSTRYRHVYVNVISI